MPSPRLLTAASVAVLTTEVKAAASEVRLLPAGEFRARDGRPKNAATWRMTGEIAAKLIADVAGRETALVIDYEHQTLLAEQNGQPAPAAGWFKALEWREGDGLYAVGVEWTERASAFIESDEYRYISPVFTYDKNGNVLQLLHVALTNNPALDNQPGVAEAVAAKFSAALSFNQETSMNEELLERLRWLLNLPVASPAADIAAHLQKVIDQLKAGPAAAATSFDLSAWVAQSQAEIAALKVVTPDPAKFVEIAVLTAVQSELSTANTELAALKAEKLDGEVDKVVTAALAARKLTPATEAWARDLGKSNFAALTAFIDKATAVVSPGGTQTQGNPPTSGNGTQLSDAQLAVCKQLCIEPEDYAKTLAAEAV